MRIIDWSSDVCSSDLGVPLSDEQAAHRLLGLGEGAAQGSGQIDAAALGEPGEPLRAGAARLHDDLDRGAVAAGVADPVDPIAESCLVTAGMEIADRDSDAVRSEERRVGKGWVSTC